MTLDRTPLAALAAFALLACGSDAQEEAPADAGTTTLTEAEIAEIVRRTIAENPELIIETVDRHFEAQALAEAAATEDQAAALIPALARGESGHAMGAPLDQAEVVVIEFFDYHCGYCKRAADFTLDLAREDGVRVVLQDLPILREESRDAAIAGLAAAESGVYPDFHRALMRTGGVLDRGALEAAARRAGAPGVVALLNDEAVVARLGAKVDRSAEAARALRLDGTPAFLIARPDGSGATIVPGYGPEQVREAMAALRAD